MLQRKWAFLVAQLVKNLPAMQETWVWSLGWGMIPWRRECLPTLVFWPGEFHGLYSPLGHQESDTTEWLTFTKKLKQSNGQGNVRGALSWTGECSREQEILIRWSGKPLRNYQWICQLGDESGMCHVHSRQRIAWYVKVLKEDQCSKSIVSEGEIK